MDKLTPDLLISAFRGIRLIMHILYAVLMAIFYPYLSQTKRRRTLRIWSRQLLEILDIGIRTEGQWPAHGEGGYLIVANHVSWLDIFVLNTVYPSRFIAKAEVRSWPLIGWICKRSNTIFIERAIHQDTATVNRHISTLLNQGVCVGLFPEGTTTDGNQVGHFHSAHIQPAIDAGAKLCPIALRYQGESGEQSYTAAFTGDTTLFQSIWRILRSPRFDALMVFTPALATAGENRRVLARAAQNAISQGLQTIDPSRKTAAQKASAFPQTMLASQPVYALLLNPHLADD
jgi:1-acyl-sn-glycerol-3-phosphate acyltransferase